MKFNAFHLALIRYTDNLPDDVGGRAKLFYIRIRPKYQNDKGIHEHELAHVEVFWLTLGLSIFIGALFKQFRIWNEARAYRVQTQYQDRDGHYMTVDEAAKRLAGNHYSFGLTLDEAKAAIER